MQARQRVWIGVGMYVVSALGMAPAFGASASVADPSLPELAWRMITACLEYAAEKKLPPLSVAVVDESGVLVGFKRQSGASPLTYEAALLKATTAVRSRESTTDLAAEAAQDPTVRDAYLLLQATIMPGGDLLFGRDSSLRGAVGVSGAEAAQDAECAKRAIAAAKP